MRYNTIQNEKLAKIHDPVLYNDDIKPSWVCIKLSNDKQTCSNVLQQTTGLQVNTATNCTSYVIHATRCSCY